MKLSFARQYYFSSVLQVGTPSVINTKTLSKSTKLAGAADTTIQQYPWALVKQPKPLFSNNNPDAFVENTSNAKTISVYFKHILEQLRVEGADSRKQIVLFGHSNAGKSSLLNALMQSEISKVSKTPGKTANLVFTRLTKSGGPGYYIVDAPGYGQASGVSKTEMDSWKRLMNYYLTRFPINQALCLVDSKLGLKKEDEMLFQMLQGAKKPFTVVMTKCDKHPGPVQAVMAKIQDMAMASSYLHLTSARTNFGISELAKHLTYIFKTTKSQKTY